MSYEGDTADKVNTAAWTFVVDRVQQLSFRRKPFLSGHIATGEISNGDWFRCPAGILGQVTSVEHVRILDEADRQVVLLVNHEAIAEGDTLTGT